MNYTHQIGKLLRLRVMRVGIIGGIGFLIQTAIFETLGVYLQLVPLSVAVVIGAEIAITTGFFLNQRFSFSDRVHHIKRVPFQFVQYHLVALGSVFIQWLFVFTAEHLTQNLFIIHAVYMSGILVGFAWTYNGYRLWVWKHEHSRVQDKENATYETH